MPNPDLGALERLVGAWHVTGGANGTATYEWMEGGSFRGTFTDQGRTLNGGWEYLGGGGYESTMTRADA